MNEGVTYDCDQPRPTARKPYALMPAGIDAVSSLPDGYDIEISDKVVVRSGQPTEQADDGNLEAQ